MCSLRVSVFVSVGIRSLPIFFCFSLVTPTLNFSHYQCVWKIPGNNCPINAWPISESTLRIYCCSFLACMFYWSICVTGLAPSQRNPSQESWKNREKDNWVIGLTCIFFHHPLLLHQWERNYNQICINFTDGEGRLGWEQRSVHYQVMESDERESVKWQIGIWSCAFKERKRQARGRTAAIALW